MKKPSRRDAGIAAAVVSAEAPITLKLDNAPMSDIARALASGQVTATALTKAYLARIEAYDRNGPALNSVRAPISTRLGSRASSTTRNHRPGGRWRASRSW